jgi:putative ABC transport system permease protein
VTILDRKLLRDLLRLWPQALAIALVMSAGVATLILAVGAYRSLDETRAAYYERNRFGDIFASVKRAPKLIEARIAQIPGVLAAETRILKSALLDIEGFAQPATALVLSLPDHRGARLNAPHVRSGGCRSRTGPARSPSTRRSPPRTASASGRASTPFSTARSTGS